MFVLKRRCYLSFFKKVKYYKTRRGAWIGQNGGVRFLYRQVCIFSIPAKQEATSEQHSLDSSIHTSRSRTAAAERSSRHTRSHGLGPAEHGRAGLHLPALPRLPSDARAVQEPAEIYFQVNYAATSCRKTWAGVTRALAMTRQATVYEQIGCLVHRHVYMLCTGSGVSWRRRARVAGREAQVARDTCIHSCPVAPVTSLALQPARAHNLLLDVCMGRYVCLCVCLHIISGHTVTQWVELTMSLSRCLPLANNN